MHTETNADVLRYLERIVPILVLKGYILFGTSISQFLQQLACLQFGHLGFIPLSEEWWCLFYVFRSAEEVQTHNITEIPNIFFTFMLIKSLRQVPIDLTTPSFPLMTSFSIENKTLNPLGVLDALFFTRCPFGKEDCAFMQPRWRIYEGYIKK